MNMTQFQVCRFVSCYLCVNKLRSSLFCFDPFQNKCLGGAAGFTASDQIFEYGVIPLTAPRLGSSVAPHNFHRLSLQVSALLCRPTDVRYYPVSVPFLSFTPWTERSRAEARCSEQTDGSVRGLGRNELTCVLQDT